MKGFVRVAAVSPRVHIGDVKANEREIAESIAALKGEDVRLAVFPELCVTGYTLGDLLLHELVVREALEATLRLAKLTGDMAVVVGLPFGADGRLFNCAAVLYGGKLRGLVPKTYLPNGNEFYETRWFVSGAQASGEACVAGESVPFMPELLFEGDGFRFAIEICEDLWTPVPPSSRYAVAGADIIVNPCASNVLAGKHAYRKELLAQQSGRLYAGYAYAGAGFGESTSDLVFDGYTAVYENGRALCEGARFGMCGGSAIADVDVQRMRFHRRRNGSFFQTGESDDICMTRVPLGADVSDGDGEYAGVGDTTGTDERTAAQHLADGSVCADTGSTAGKGISAASVPQNNMQLLRPLMPLPFVPEGADEASRLEEITQIQVTGLVTRLTAIGSKSLVIGVSGGLDSTLSLLIAARAFDAAGLSRAGIYAITMPGMGTGARTKGNADRLMEALQVTALEIPIGKAVMQHFADIGQSESLHDVTYENSQARERTQILMDYANKVNGLVLGTGDMSELALGFCTYNGDHMSMYNVNCSVPKTLVRSLVRYLGASCFGGAARDICEDILATPISPELIPVTEGELNQRTEDILGDYALHDFFLYHMLDSGSEPERLHMMARQAFSGVYSDEQIIKQLRTFLKRFFAQQFKRNCAPDGPKVGSISLSPRGDLRMPSDMGSRMWMDDIK